MEFVVRTIRTLFYSLDKVIYGLIGDVYGLLMQIARTSVFSQDTINEFSKRIYALIGMFMLFKISVSLINYVLNPDDFSDKEKGFTQIIKRVILSLVLIVLTPYIFTEAYELQSIILEENTIMNVIFGAPAGGAELTPATAIQTAGQKMQFTIMYAFAQPNYAEFTQSDAADLTNCKQPYAQVKSYADISSDEVSSGIDIGDYLFETISTGQSDFIYKLNEDCFGTRVTTGDNEGQYNCEDEKTGSLCWLFKDEAEITDEKETPAPATFQDYAHGVAEQNFDLFFRKSVILAREKSARDGSDTRRYFINYKMGISTAVGVAVLYLLLMFCIDIAVRSVKLGFLQMIAPIPILSYCDPKSSKDGMFSKWVHMCTSTYLELFFRLAALYFGIYVISLIGKFRDVVTGQTVSGPLITIFMIIGILIFIKKLPDIIKEIFNIKGSGKFTLNPLKKLEDEAVLGKRITGAAAGATIGLLGGGPARMLSGAIHGGIENKGLTEQARRQAEMNRRIREARYNGTTFGGRMNERIGQLLGTETNAETFERQAQEAQARLDFNQANLDYAKGVKSHILDELKTKHFEDGHAWTKAQEHLLQAQATLEAARQKGDDKLIASAQSAYNEAEDTAYKMAMGTGFEDGYMQSSRRQYNTRVVNNASLAKQAGVTTMTGPAKATELDSIKSKSQGQVDTAQSDVYEYKTSHEASQYRGDKTYVDATKFK